LSEPATEYEYQPGRVRLAQLAVRRAPLAAAILAASVLARAASGDPTILASSNGEYAPGGTETCLGCHDETSKYPVLSIFATQHGVKADERTPIGSAHGCETCHGPGRAHVEAGGGRGQGGPDFFAFRPDSGQEASAQNAACLGCHQGGARMNWAGSPHENANLICANCHKIHAKEDPVRKVDIRPNVIFKDNQSAVCFTCHLEQRALSFRLSHHPVQEGKVACSDCHNPHGSMAPFQLAKPTLNDTCYQCHAEKRGPFLWEHAPAREDCAICHTPHGSNHPSLLVNRMPLLCQQCHMAAFHPSSAYTGANASVQPQSSRLDFHVAGKGCLNCHSEVHGSNHPSGPRLTR
jgi:DmsE family decaheme c-type cytochrome